MQALGAGKLGDFEDIYEPLEEEIDQLNDETFGAGAEGKLLNWWSLVLQPHMKESSLVSQAEQHGYFGTLIGGEGGALTNQVMC